MATKPKKIEGPADTMAPAELSAIDETDTVLAAHLRRQQDWFKPENLEQLFPEETRAEARKRDLLDKLGAIDAQRTRDMRDAEEKRAAAEAAANRDKRMAEIVAQKAILDEEHAALKAGA